MKVGRRSFQASTGASLMEAALVFPVLLLLLFGIIQWGFIFAAQVTLRASAAAAVRELAVIGTVDCPTLRTVAGGAISPLLDPALMDLDLDEWVPTGGGNPMRRVTLVYDFSVLLPFVVPNASGGSLRLRADAAMRCEQSCGATVPTFCPGP